jgi:hypothetical protein
MAETMRELAEAQKQTVSWMGELAQAQIRAEGSLTALAQAEAQTVIWLGEIARAQAQTESRLGELAQAQKQTEIRVGELAQAQRQTFKTLEILAQELGKTRQDVGGLSDAVGFRLADAACKALPELIERDLGIRVKGRLIRKHITDKDGKSLEVDIFGTAFKDGNEVAIVGESKSQLSKRDVDDFREKLESLEGVFPEIVPVLVTYMTRARNVQEYVKKRKISLYYSYDF